MNIVNTLTLCNSYIILFLLLIVLLILFLLILFILFLFLYENKLPTTIYNWFCFIVKCRWISYFKKPAEDREIDLSGNIL